MIDPAVAADYLDDHCPRPELPATVRVATYLALHPESSLFHLLDAAATTCRAADLHDLHRAITLVAAVLDTRPGTAWHAGRPAPPYHCHHRHPDGTDAFTTPEPAGPFQHQTCTLCHWTRGELTPRPSPDPTPESTMAHDDMSPLSRVADHDLTTRPAAELVAEIRLFRAALAYCRRQQGDDHCWMDYRHLLMRFLPGYNPATDDVTLATDQLANCQSFIRCWQEDQPWTCLGGDRGQTIQARSVGTLDCLTTDSDPDQT